MLWYIFIVPIYYFSRLLVFHDIAMNRKLKNLQLWQVIVITLFSLSIVSQLRIIKHLRYHSFLKAPLYDLEKFLPDTHQLLCDHMTARDT